jgi:hypothetical protein
LPEGTYTFTAAEGGSNGPQSAPFLVTVDLTPPVVDLTAPASTTDRSPEVRVTATDLHGLPDGTHVRLDVDLNNDGDFTDTGETAYTTSTLTSGSATFSVQPDLTVGTTVRMRARVTDLAGNEGTSLSKSVEITPATVSLTNDYRTVDPLSGRFLPQVGTLVVSHPLDLDRSPGTGQSLGAGLVYDSGSVNVRPSIQARLQTDNAAPLPPTVRVQLYWDDVAQPATDYSTAGYSPGELFTVAAQVPAAVTGMGRHTWKLRVTFPGGPPDELEVSDVAYVAAMDDSPFGAGWRLSVLDRLVRVNNPNDPNQELGQLRVYGSGGYSFYQKSGASYLSPQGDNGTLAAAGGGWTYSTPDSRTWTFNASGCRPPGPAPTARRP